MKIIDKGAECVKTEIAEGSNHASDNGNECDNSSEAFVWCLAENMKRTNNFLLPERTEMPSRCIVVR